MDGIYVKRNYDGNSSPSWVFLKEGKVIYKQKADGYMIAVGNVFTAVNPSIKYLSEAKGSYEAYLEIETPEGSRKTSNSVYFDITNKIVPK